MNLKTKENNVNDMSTEIDRNNLIKCIKETESIILSIIVVSKGLVNTGSINVNNNPDCDKNTICNKNIKSQDNLILLNITHTDSYLQDLNSRFSSLYNQLGAKFIFPIEIWQNNIENTLESTGNINRYIYNQFKKSNIMKKFSVNIMIDNIKQNIPKYNYVVSPDVINFFSQICEQLSMNKIYFSEWVKKIKSNNIDELKNFIESKYNIESSVVIQDFNLGMTSKQIQYFRQYGLYGQYGITNNNKIFSKKRKMNNIETETNKKKKISNETCLFSKHLDIKESDELDELNELDSFDINIELF